MSVTIRNIAPDLLDKAIDVYTRAFINDPLHLYAFFGLNQRITLTRLVYELVVKEIVPVMERKLIGAFTGNDLVGVAIYSIPESKQDWDESLNTAVKKMQEKANDESIYIIGEYASMCADFRPDKPHYYITDIAVRPDVQGRGIGRTMMNYIIDESDKRIDVDGIWLDTTNEKNMIWYKTMGFEVESEFFFHKLKCYTMYKPAL